MGKKGRKKGAEEQNSPTTREPSAKKVKQVPHAEMLNKGASSKVPVSLNTILDVFQDYVSSLHQFIEKLKLFLEEFCDSLSDVHVEFTNKEIQQLEKDEKIASRSPRTSIAEPTLVETKIDDYMKPKIDKAGVGITKKSEKELTAFDFYKLAKEHKYTELEENDRDAKLRRHFERLDESKRAKFEEQAENH